jgi:uncharacterized membrane protein YfcA
VTGAGPDFSAIVEAGRSHRERTTRDRTRQALTLSFGVLILWLVFVTVQGHWGRVGDQWASALTMVFGSFVAGSTPQGGGAVAFPVFTKVLDIDTPVARSFSLCIQTIGMGTAAAAIIINRRAVAWRAVAIAAPAAVVGFLISALLLGRSDEPFWPSRLPGPYVKVTFTLLVAAMAVVVYLGYRVHLLERIEKLDISGPRVIGAIATAGIVGGVASSLTGSGADVILYLAVVVVIGVTPRIGVPTSVVVMAVVSIVGFIVYGLVDGQLDITITGDEVTAIGGQSVTANSNGIAVFGDGPGVDASRYDLFGLWLAAAPVVAFGAPLGSWVSSLASDRQLVRFVVALALLETVSTVIFLEGLVIDPDPALIAYSIVGAIIVISGLWACKEYRRQLLGLPPVDLSQPFTRSRLDAGPEFREQLDQGRRPEEKK